VAIKKLNTTIPPVSLNSMWGTSTGSGGYVYPSVTSGTTLTTNNTTINWGNGISMNSDIIEYIDIFYQFMGIDMDYKRFSEMTKEEKKGFIRDLKLKKLIDEK
jgi:hypothetical protein